MEIVFNTDMNWLIDWLVDLKNKSQQIDKNNLWNLIVILVFSKKDCSHHAASNVPFVRLFCGSVADITKDISSAYNFQQ